MMLVRYGGRRAHLTSALGWRPAAVLTTASSEPRALRGPQGSALRQTSTAVPNPGDGGQLGTAPGGASSWNTVLSLHMRCRTEPMRRAKATIPRFRPRRFATCAAQLLSHEARPRFIMTVAAWHSARRRLASPARVIPPLTSRSPDWLREGVRSTQGPTFLDEENRVGSSMAERKVKATTAPTPGMLMSRQQTGSSF